VVTHSWHLHEVVLDENEPLTSHLNGEEGVRAIIVPINLSVTKTLHKTLAWGLEAGGSRFAFTEGEVLWEGRGNVVQWLR
jgi:hypothetical protein